MTTLLESLNAKARADAVYEITLEELVAWFGSQAYSPIGQAALNHLERLKRQVAKLEKTVERYAEAMEEDGDV